MMLNRNQRREQNRKNKRLQNWSLNLTVEQRQLIMDLMVENSKADLYCFGHSLETILRVILNEKYDNELIAERKLSEIVDLIGEEGNKIKEFREKGEDYIMEIKNNKQGIIKAYEKMKGLKMKDKDIYEELFLKYPKFSNNAIKNVILEYKKDQKSKEAEAEVQKAAEYVLSEEKTVETKRKPATINKDFNDTVQDMINGIMLEEISKKVIADVKGSLGEYHIEDNKVTINNFTFATEKDVDQEIALRRKVIEDQLKELEVMDKEYKAVIKKYIA